MASVGRGGRQWEELIRVCLSSGKVRRQPAHGMVEVRVEVRVLVRVLVSEGEGPGRGSPDRVWEQVLR